ncbi:hypothetical protein D3C76_1388460 [compost metagenome]
MYAVGVVEDALADRIVVQGVDGEVAALRVFFQGAVDIVAQDPPTLVTRRGVAVLFFAFRVVGAEGGDFDDFTPEMDVNQFETATDDTGVTKFGADLFRGGAGGDVEILGGDAQKLVPHAATDQVGLVASVLQALDDVHRMATELAALQRMLTTIDHFGRGANMVLATHGRTE